MLNILHTTRRLVSAITITRFDEDLIEGNSFHDFRA